MRAFEFLLVEAQGGMWDRMLEKKSGAQIQFINGNNTYDLINVAVFPLRRLSTNQQCFCQHLLLDQFRYIHIRYQR